MSNGTEITLIGNLVDEVELRWTPSSVAVAKFRVASTPRVFDKDTNQWKDGEGLFLTCSVWRQQAENAAGTLQRGMRVIVQGRLKQRSYEDREGVKRTVYEVDAEEVGVSLLRASAQVSKTSGGGGGQSQQGQGQGGSQFASGRPQAQGDPWASQPAAGQAAGGWGGASGAGDSEPPF